MGEIADDIQNGLMCQYCGVWMPEVEKYIESEGKNPDPWKNPPGYPRTCTDCRLEIDTRNCTKIG